MKYELVGPGKTIRVGGDDVVVRQVRALVSFAMAHKGELGGWIEHGWNLSQEGECWLREEAVCVHGAQILENAKVFDNAVISGAAQLSGGALVGGKALVRGDAQVRGNAMVKGAAVVSGTAELEGFFEIAAGTVTSGVHTRSLWSCG